MYCWFILAGKLTYARHIAIIYHVSSVSLPHTVLVNYSVRYVPSGVVVQCISTSNGNFGISFLSDSIQVLDRYLLNR